MVQNRLLAIRLTEKEYESFESNLKSQQQIREELKEKPCELKRYEKSDIKQLSTITKRSAFVREVIKIN